MCEERINRPVLDLRQSWRTFVVGMLGIVGRSGSTAFSGECGSWLLSLSLSLQVSCWLPSYSGPLNWFPERCCLMDSFDPAASPSFRHTTCKHRRRVKRRRGAAEKKHAEGDRQTWRQSLKKKKPFFFQSENFKCAQFDFELQRLHTHTELQYSYLHFCRLPVRGFALVPRSPSQ